MEAWKIGEEGDTTGGKDLLPVKVTSRSATYDVGDAVVPLTDAGSIAKRPCGISIKVSIILLSVLLLVSSLAIVVLINFYAHRNTGTELGADVRAEVIKNVENQVLGIVSQPHDEATRQHFYLTSGVINMDSNPADSNLPTSVMRYQAKVMSTRPFIGALYTINRRGFAGFYRAGSNVEFVTLTNWDDFRPNELIFAPSDADGNVDYGAGEAIPYDRASEEWISFAFSTKAPVWSPIYTVPSEADTLFVSAYHPIVDAATGDTTAFVGVDLTTTQLDRFMATVSLGESGVVFLVEVSTGILVSKSSPEGDTISVDENGAVQPVFARECGNSFIEGAVAALGADLSRVVSGSEVRFVHDGTGAKMVLDPKRVTDVYGLNWLIVGVARESDFWGTSEESAYSALFVGIGVTAAAGLSSVFLSIMITRPLKVLSGRMDRLSRLEGDVEQDLGTGYGANGTRASVFSEVSVLEDAFGRMVRGVQSYIRFVPLEVVRGTMASGTVATVGLEPGNVTVLFSDIANFTSISKSLDPVKLSHLLGEFFQEMSDAITENEGTIDKFIGDAVMAFWNGVSPVDDHPAKAARAAVAMQKRLDALRRKWVKQGLPAVHMRVGIATGPVMLGNIGSTSRLNYTLIGNTVNIAARLEGVCKEFNAQILVDEAVHTKIHGRAEFGSLVDHGRVAVKGFEENIQVFEVRP